MGTSVVDAIAQAKVGRSNFTRRQDVLEAAQVVEGLLEGWVFCNIRKSEYSRRLRVTATLVVDIAYLRVE